MDSATYDDAEERARQAVPSWTWPAMMAPGKFDSGRFPTRAPTLHHLRPLLDAMHQTRFEAVMRELNGVSAAEIDELVAVTRRYCEFAVETFQDSTVVLPMNTLINEFLVSRKLLGLPRRASVLEIGAGCGYLPFFCDRERGFDRRAAIEVTQSLYILQSKICRFLFGATFDDRAMAPLPGVAVGGLSGRLATPHPWHEVQARVTVPVDRHVTLYPWWRIDDALNGSTTYDVVLSNANIREMSYAAFLYYFGALPGCLAPDGVVLIQDLGAPNHHTEVETAMLKALDRNGYRALVNASADTAGARFSTQNLLLVREGHPHWDDARSPCSEARFPAEIPLVRSVFGLDRPQHERLDRAKLFQLFLQKVG